MQSKRAKRSRIRAAKVTAGHGHKKKNRGSGNRGGFGKSGQGKRGDAKLMKVTGGVRNLGKHGFNSIKKELTTINLQELQNRLNYLVETKKADLKKDIYFVDLTKLGFDKLLSKGIVSKKMEIVVERSTENAVQKVTSNGGKVILPDKSEEN